MTPRILPFLAASVCVLLASCYPYPENRPPRRPPPTKPTKPTVTPEEQAKIDAIKAKEEAARKEKERQAGNKPPIDDRDINGNTNPPDIDPPVKPPVTPPPSRDYEFAKKAPGKDGFVLSPYNNRLVDVRGIKTGTLVMDPTYPPAEKKYFRVP